MRAAPTLLEKGKEAGMPCWQSCQSEKNAGEKCHKMGAVFKGSIRESFMENVAFVLAPGGHSRSDSEMLGEL